MMQVLIKRSLSLSRNPAAQKFLFSNQKGHAEDKLISIRQTN